MPVKIIIVLEIIYVHNRCRQITTTSTEDMITFISAAMEYEKELYKKEGPQYPTQYTLREGKRALLYKDTAPFP